MCISNMADFEEAEKDSVSSEKDSVSPVNSPQHNTNDSDWKPASDWDDSDGVSETLNSAGRGKKRKRGKKCQWDSDDLGSVYN